MRSIRLSTNDDAVKSLCERIGAILKKTKGIKKEVTLGESSDEVQSKRVNSKVNDSLIHQTHMLKDLGSLYINHYTGYQNEFTQAYQQVCFDVNYLNRRKVPISWCIVEKNGLAVPEDSPTLQSNCSIFFDMDCSIQVSPLLSKIVDCYNYFRDVTKRAGIIGVPDGSCALEKKALQCYFDGNHLQTLFKLPSLGKSVSEFNLNDISEIYLDNVTESDFESTILNDINLYFETQDITYIVRIQLVYEKFVEYLYKVMLLPTFFVFAETIQRCFPKSSVRRTQLEFGEIRMLDLRDLDTNQESADKYKKFQDSLNTSVYMAVVDILASKTLKPDVLIGEGYQGYKLGWHVHAPHIVHYNGQNLKFRQIFMNELNSNNLTKHLLSRCHNYNSKDVKKFRICEFGPSQLLKCDFVGNEWDDIVDDHPLNPGSGLRSIYSYKTDKCTKCKRSEISAINWEISELIAQKKGVPQATHQKKQELINSLPSNWCVQCSNYGHMLLPHVYIPTCHIIQSPDSSTVTFEMYGDLINPRNREKVNFRDYSIRVGYYDRQVLCHSPLYNQMDNVIKLSKAQTKSVLKHTKIICSTISRDGSEATILAPSGMSTEKFFTFIEKLTSLDEKLNETKLKSITDVTSCHDSNTERVVVPINSNLAEKIKNETLSLVQHAEKSNKDFFHYSSRRFLNQLGGPCYKSISKLQELLRNCEALTTKIDSQTSLTPSNLHKVSQWECLRIDNILVSIDKYSQFRIKVDVVGIKYCLLKGRGGASDESHTSNRILFQLETPRLVYKNISNEYYKFYQHCYSHKPQLYKHYLSGEVMPCSQLYQHDPRHAIFLFLPAQAMIEWFQEFTHEFLDTLRSHADQQLSKKFYSENLFYSQEFNTTQYLTKTLKELTGFPVRPQDEYLFQPLNYKFMNSLSCLDQPLGTPQTEVTPQSNSSNGSNSSSNSSSYNAQDEISKALSLSFISENDLPQVDVKWSTSAKGRKTITTKRKNEITLNNLNDPSISEGSIAAVQNYAAAIELEKIKQKQTLKAKRDRQVKAANMRKFVNECSNHSSSPHPLPSIQTLSQSSYNSQSPTLLPSFASITSNFSPVMPSLSIVESVSSNGDDTRSSMDFPVALATSLTSNVTSSSTSSSNRPPLVSDSGRSISIGSIVFNNATINNIDMPPLSSKSASKDMINKMKLMLSKHMSHK